MLAVRSCALLAPDASQPRLEHGILRAEVGLRHQRQHGQHQTDAHRLQQHPDQHQACHRQGRPSLLRGEHVPEFS
jgi:hypothetical protein